MNEINNKKGQHIFGAAILGIIVVFMLKGMFDNAIVKRKGVFVMGRLYKIVQGGKNLPTSHFYFYLKGQRHEFSYRDGGVSDSVRMFQVLLTDPEDVVILDDTVPSCLHFEDVPAEGWKEIPSCK